jgi:DNA-binding transcriptional regulator PaaX
MKNKFDIIKIMDQFADFLVKLAFSKANQRYLYYGYESKISRSNYYYQLNKFKKHGLLKRTKHNGMFVYQITDKAKELRSGAVEKVKRQDGYSTIVIFDIPEGLRNTRNSLRRTLIRNGYTQIQKSVFISPFKVSSQIRDLLKELGIENNVTFISGKIDR